MLVSRHRFWNFWKPIPCLRLSSLRIFTSVQSIFDSIGVSFYNIWRCFSFLSIWQINIELFWVPCQHQIFKSNLASTRIMTLLHNGYELFRPQRMFWVNMVQRAKYWLESHREIFVSFNLDMLHALQRFIRLVMREVEVQKACITYSLNLGVSYTIGPWMLLRQAWKLQIIYLEPIFLFKWIEFISNFRHIRPLNFSFVFFTVLELLCIINLGFFIQTSVWWLLSDVIIRHLFLRNNGWFSFNAESFFWTVWVR